MDSQRPINAVNLIHTQSFNPSFGLFNLLDQIALQSLKYLFLFDLVVDFGVQVAQLLPQLLQWNLCFQGLASGVQGLLLSLGQDSLQSADRFFVVLEHQVGLGEQDFVLVLFVGYFL